MGMKYWERRMGILIRRSLRLFYGKRPGTQANGTEFRGTAVADLAGELLPWVIATAPMGEPPELWQACDIFNVTS
jgi:hypothetical protein